MGRSVLAPEAVRAVEEACSGYSNLEFDIRSGERGSRYSHIEDLITRLTGAEAALVVNNNAAAVLLVLDTLAKGREVIVSRGQLVEIGGSFRIPDVMAKSGAVLREVGCTNRTHPDDYRSAITSDTALLMRVHASNYKVVGFTSEASVLELRRIADAFSLPLYEDMGSGTLFNFAAHGLPGEPTVQELVGQGVDICSFSGDKALGGPQAGIIAGRRQYLDPIKRNPLTRALRIGKETVAALEATLRLYLDPSAAARSVPTLAMAVMDPATLRSRASRLAQRLREVAGDLPVAVRKSVSRIGGGAFPEKDIKTWVAAIGPSPAMSADRMKARLLAAGTPVVARIEEDALVFDPRTLLPGQSVLVARAVAEVVLQMEQDKE